MYPASLLSITQLIWLPSLIMAPFSFIPWIILILMGSMSILSRTIVSLEIRLAPLIGKESNEFIVLNKLFNKLVTPVLASAFGMLVFDWLHFVDKITIM
jgi:hypothetical protein